MAEKISEKSINKNSVSKNKKYSRYNTKLPSLLKILLLPYFSVHKLPKKGAFLHSVGGAKKCHC